MIEKKKNLSTNQLGVEEVCLKPKKAIFDKLAASIRRNSESWHFFLQYEAQTSHS